MINIPNTLTLSRIVLVPVCAVCFDRALNSTSAQLMWISFGVAVMVELTDLFDGYLARVLKQVSDFGKIFDPATDVIARLTMLTAFAKNEIIPWWLILVFVNREIAMGGIRSILTSRGVVASANWAGKLKTFVMGASILGTVFVFALELTYGALLGRHPWIEGVAVSLIYAGAVLTVVSFVIYLYTYRNHLRLSLKS